MSTGQSSRTKTSRGTAFPEYGEVVLLLARTPHDNIVVALCEARCGGDGDATLGEATLPLNAAHLGSKDCALEARDPGGAVAGIVEVEAVWEGEVLHQGGAS